jgi:hypothetical protein
MSSHWLKFHKEHGKMDTRTNLASQKKLHRCVECAEVILCDVEEICKHVVERHGMSLVAYKKRVKT